MKRRIAALILSLAIIFSFACLAFAEGEVEPVEPTGWEKFIEALKEAIINLWNGFVDYIRSPKSIEMNNAIAEALRDFGYDTIQFLRETFDLFIN